MRVLSPRAALACYGMLLLAYLAGVAVPLLEGDPSRYAALALRLQETGDWTKVAAVQGYQGEPYLLLWLMALSFELFGVNTVACKLPSLLFFVLAIHSTIRVGALLYNETVGRLAGVILASSFALLFANDMADMNALLIGSVMFATCQLMIFATDDNKLAGRAHLVVAGAGLALGLAARGLVGVVLPLVAVFLYLIHRLEWRRIFTPFWLLLPLFVLLFASPVLYAWHVQGQDWTQFFQWIQLAEHRSAERFEGSESLIFYCCSYLWAFLPWSVMALWALTSGVMRLINDRYWSRAHGEALTVGVILFAFILLSVAGFRLLHYISVLMPFFAILLAGWLSARLRHAPSLHHLWQVQYVVFAVMVGATIVFNGWMFPLRDWLVGELALVLPVLAIWVIPRWVRGARLILVSVSFSAAFWLLINLNLYVVLPDYQAGIGLGEAVAKQNILPDSIHYLEDGGMSAGFEITVHRMGVYRPIPVLTLEELARRTKPTVLFVTARGRDLIEEKGLRPDVLAKNSDADVSHPGWKFLNPNTRVMELRSVYLLRVKPQ